MKQTVVVAIGGNAITRNGQSGTIEEQIENVGSCCEPIIGLLQKGVRVILTHGNGPQVGNLMLQNEAAKGSIPSNPLDVCGAQTQGSLGYIISQTLANRMREKGIDPKITSVVTQVVVGKNDPKFKAPSKPVGPFFSKEEAELLEKAKGYHMVEDSGRGYRRVVPSPTPLELIEKDAVKTLSEEGFLVIACGGGGIPVVREGGHLRGVEAVIDKDYASALVAEEVGADTLMILTGVPRVSINYGKPDQRELRELTVTDARRYLQEGQFPPGSMGPKIEAACRFVERTRREAVITSIDCLQDALESTGGTTIIPA